MNNRPVTVARVPTLIDPVSGRGYPAIAPPFVGVVVGDVVIADMTFGSTDAYARFTVAHELGHVWDHRSGGRLTRGLIEALGTWICFAEGRCGWYPYAAHTGPETLAIVYPEPAPGTRRGCQGPPTAQCPEPYATQERGPLGLGPGAEDWAQTFATFVYPGFWNTRNLNEIGLLPGGVRDSYVRDQIAAIR